MCRAHVDCKHHSKSLLSVSDRGWGFDTAPKLAAGALSDAALALSLIVLGSGRLAASGQTPAPAAQRDAEPATQDATDPAPAQSGYVGQETCLTCHETATVHGTAHGNARIPGAPAADKGCESCHGPGRAHVEDVAKGHMLKFSQMPVMHDRQ
jgi:hypothetical protein